jgi:hypothetical protein
MPTHRVHLYHHPAATVGTVAWRFEYGSFAAVRVAPAGGPAALTAVERQVRHQRIRSDGQQRFGASDIRRAIPHRDNPKPDHLIHYSVADNALIGILSSASRPMSDSAGRPRVVR